MDKGKIVVIGDSLAEGENVDKPGEKYGWVHMLQELFPKIEVLNWGRGGSTAQGWVANREKWEKKLRDVRADAVVMQLGGNDLQTYTQHDGWFSPRELSEFSRGITALLYSIKACLSVKELVLVDYYDLFDLQSVMLPEDQKQYRHVSTSVMMMNSELQSFLWYTFGCEMASIHQDFVGHGYMGDNAYFGKEFDIHPNDLGHLQIAGKVAEALDRIQI